MQISAPWQRRWLTLLSLAPIAIIVGAYGWLSVAHGTPLLWNVVIHEGGHYTFAGTVLFVRHHLREIPIDIAMSLAIAASVVAVAPAGNSLRRRWPLWVALGLMATTFAASAAEEGVREAVRDLLQFRTRDDDVHYGSHWRFHLLSTIWIACAAPLLAALTTGSARLLRPEGYARRLSVATWLLIVVLTIGFGMTSEPFTSARYIGHQAREILTHGVITLPLVFALGVRLSGNRAAAEGGVAVSSPGARPSALGAPLSAAAWVAVLGIPLFLLIAFSGSGLEGTAQLSSGLSGVVAAHVFEHVLDYLLVTMLTLGLIGNKIGAPGILQR